MRQFRLILASQVTTSVKVANIGCDPGNLIVFVARKPAFSFVPSVTPLLATLDVQIGVNYMFIKTIREKVGLVICPVFLLL